MTFRIQGLSAQHFAHLVHADDDALRAHGAERYSVRDHPGAPCRISLDDAEIGETVLLLNYAHQTADTPYRQSGPIFVREAPCTRFNATDIIPPALAVRLISLRAFNAAGAMINADLTEGAALPALIETFFADDTVAYMHAHYAKRGCYAALITRT